MITLSKPHKILENMINDCLESGMHYLYVFTCVKKTRLQHMQKHDYIKIAI